MPISANYVSRETLSNLWRNRLMTLAAILTVAVSLALVGAALLLKQGAAQATFQWQRGTQVKVWMQPTATPSEVNAVGTELRRDPSVQSCVYRNQQWSFNEAQRLDPYVVSESGMKPSQVPTSWRCNPTHPQEVNTVISRYTGQPGVKVVTAPIGAIHTMETWINWLKWTFIGVAVVLLVSAAVLILNSIRMAIFARRREVSVMKLVGATNWFIRLPFMSEGFIQGITGSLLAAGVVYGLHVLMDHLGHAGDTITFLRLTGWQIVATDAVVLFVGAAIGTLGSAFAIRRFLDV